jgi:hypothetical protein
LLTAKSMSGRASFVAVAIVLICVGASVWSVPGLAQAETAWQSVEILEGVSAGDMDVFMRAMNASLGTECESCHEPGQWHLEGNPRKEVARGMMRMIARLSEGSFQALDLPTCWTCHRGDVIPVSGNAGVDDVDYPAGAFATSREPAGQVYDNVLQYLNTPAEDLEDVMVGYSAALGVGCDYCHQPDNFASDERVTKLLTRRMLEIQREVQAEFFEAGPDISCWTCHRGEAVPAMTLPPDLLSNP